MSVIKKKFLFFFFFIFFTYLPAVFSAMNQMLIEQQPVPLFCLAISHLAIKTVTFCFFFFFFSTNL